MIIHGYLSRDWEPEVAEPEVAEPSRRDGPIRCPFCHMRLSSVNPPPGSDWRPYAGKFECRLCKVVWDKPLCDWPGCARPWSMHSETPRPFTNPAYLPDYYDHTGWNQDQKARAKWYLYFAFRLKLHRPRARYGWPDYRDSVRFRNPSRKGAQWSPTATFAALDDIEFRAERARAL